MTDAAMWGVGIGAAALYAFGAGAAFALLDKPGAWDTPLPFMGTIAWPLGLPALLGHRLAVWATTPRPKRQPSYEPGATYRDAKEKADAR